MFKKLGDLIYRTPWWGLVVGGLVVLVTLVLFTIPIHLLRLPDSAKTPEERSAIKREINIAFGDRALDVAEAVVGSMKARTTDPDRRRELERALTEVARARNELAQAQTTIAGAHAEAARDAADAAVATATTAAESSLESATEALEAIQEAREEALDKLRSKGIDTTKAARSFDELLKSAKESEANARESLAAIEAIGKEPAADAPAARARKSLPERKSPDTPAPALAAGAGADPGAAKSSAGDTGSAGSNRPRIQIHIPVEIGAHLLPPEVRTDIRQKVAGDVWRVGVGSALILIFIPVFIMLVLVKYFIGRSRRALAFAEEKKQEAKVSDVSRQVTEARLQALQAQVEPHFLYNTLANVQALTETDPPAANAMVGHLIQYLRAALPKMRENTSTIGQEIELVTAYLNVLKMRMGPRLEFGIDVPADLLGRPFPPLMLPSLVENAIKHGLEPLREGGRIDLVAVRVRGPDGDRIRVQVKDTGRGFADAPVQAGSGIGLSNLRERLKALYGDRASFVIESNVPKGVVATIEIPVEGAASPAGTAPPGAVPAQERAGEAPVSGWRRAWRATSKTHSVWAWIISRVFIGLMALLAIFFLLALIGLYTGWMPVDVGTLRLQGAESIALGTVMLLVGFAAAAFAISVVVAVVYGLGFLVAGILLFALAIVLIALFPVVSPFILIGLAIYWLWWKKRRRPDSANTGSPPTGTGA